MPRPPPPPPTRFGPAAPAQPMPGPAIRPGAVPPPTRFGPAAPAQPMQAPPMQAPSRSGNAVQPMLPKSVKFSIPQENQEMFDVSKDIKQEDLEGESKKGGTKKFWGQKEAQNPKKQQNYVESTSSVYAFLKINGQYAFAGKNSKAHKDLVFHGIGDTNQGGVKDNFHAEDWVINSFMHAVEESKLSLAKYLDANYPTTSNSATGKKHVFSLRINFSSCLGCTGTIMNFRQWLSKGLGEGNFILRVKFLRPYKLPVTLSDDTSDSAVDFVSSMYGLMKQKIYVRMQPKNSALKMYKTIPDDVKIATVHQGVKEVVDSKLYQHVNQTRKQLGANRKK